MGVSSKTDEINQLCTCAGTSYIAIVDMVEKALGSGSRVYLKQGMFNVTIVHFPGLLPGLLSFSSILGFAQLTLTGRVATMVQLFINFKIGS